VAHLELEMRERHHESEAHQALIAACHGAVDTLTDVVVRQVQAAILAQIDEVNRNVLTAHNTLDATMRQLHAKVRILHIRVSLHLWHHAPAARQGENPTH
jgi:hypothetical protein